MPSEAPQEHRKAAITAQAKRQAPAPADWQAGARHAVHYRKQHYTRIEATELSHWAGQASVPALLSWPQPDADALRGVQETGHAESEPHIPSAYTPISRYATLWRKIVVTEPFKCPFK